jgi:hypothetical protein
MPGSLPNKPKRPVLKRMASYNRLKGVLPAIHPAGTPSSTPNKNTITAALHGMLDGNNQQF